MRIALLDPQDHLIGHLNNDGSDALQYRDDELHEVLTGTAAELTMTVDVSHPLSPLVTEGCKLAFRSNGRDFYMNIISTDKDHYGNRITAWSTCLDLTLENEEAFSASEAHPLSWYFSKYNWEGMLTLGINEVSDKSIKCSWEGENTLLQLYYSIASKFDAEIEFVPHIDSAGSLESITCNFYRKHDDKNQGIGTRLSRILRYGKEITGVTRKGDISDLYTAIKPYGKDRLGITSLAGRQVLDDDGEVLYYVDDMGYIRAPQAMSQFPSANTSLTNAYNRYIVRKVTTDYESVESLYGYALAELKKHDHPAVTYSFEGNTDAGIGDTMVIADHSWNPPLFVEVRVTEQIRSLDGLVKGTTYSSDFSYPEIPAQSPEQAQSTNSLDAGTALAILKGDI